MRATSVATTFNPANPRHASVNMTTVQDGDFVLVSLDNVRA